MPSAEASGAICVQKLDDSRNSAIHIKYRISLRSSSLREPRYPLLRVVCWFVSRPSLVSRVAKLQLVCHASVVEVLASGQARRAALTPRGTPLASGEAHVPPHKTFSSVFTRNRIPPKGESQAGQRRRPGTRARAHAAPKGGTHGGT